jgi:hypothetical protein
MTGKPDIVSACSCTACQRKSGSAFGVSSYWPKSALESIAGESKLYRRISDRGRWLDRHFCPICGSSVYWYLEARPDSIGVSVGCFADPSFEPPIRAIWCASKHPWVTFPEGCQEHQQQTL